MRKFTFILSLLVAFVTTAMAQGTRLTASDLNAVESSKRIAIRCTQESAYNTFYDGVGRTAELSPSIIFVWENAGENQFYIKKAYGADESTAYLQSNNLTTFGAVGTAAKFTAVKPYTDGAGVENFGGANCFEDQATGGDYWVRLSIGSTWFNFNGMVYNSGTGVWTVQNVLDMSNYYQLTINSVVGEEITTKTIMVEAGAAITVDAKDGYTHDFEAQNMPANDYTITVTYTADENVEEPEAVEVITDLSQLSNSRKYFIESARCFLMYTETVADYLTTSNGTAVGTVEKNPENANQQFQIVKDGESYYLYSVGAEKYVNSAGAFVAEKTDALTLENVGGTYQWKLCIGGKGLNSQDPGQMPNGIIVNGWTTTDAGNCYKIIDAEYALTVELAIVKGELDAMVAYANGMLDSRTMTEEQKTAIEDAIAEANDAFEAAASLSDIAGIRTKIANINTKVADAIYLKSLENLSNSVAYVVSNSRGAWVTNGTALTSTQKIEVEKDITSTAQHFAFITSENDNIYLYSISDKKFVSKSGDGTKLTDTPEQNVYFQNGTYTGHPWVVTLEDGSQMGISNGYDPAVITFWNSLSDQGNCVNLEPAATFNPAEALALIATYEATLEPEVPEVTISSLADANPNKAYTATTQRASWAVGADELGVTTALDAAEPNHQFAFIKGSDENYYLWSVGAAKFVTSSKALSTTVCEPIIFHDASSVEAGRVMVQFDGNSLGYFNITGVPALQIDGWSWVDAGNAVKFVEVADFDPATAVAALEAYLTTGVYKEELNALIAELDLIVAVVGTQIGCYTSSDAEYAAKLDAIKAFAAAMDDKTTEQIQAQIAAAEALKATFSTINPTANNYYFIKNSTTVWTADDLAVYANTDVPAWKAFNENDVNFWWKAVAVEGGIAFQNVATGTYLTGNAAVSGAWSLTETGSAIEFVALGFAANENALVNITLNNLNMHAGGHGGGANTSGTIVSWNGDATSASVWEIVDGDATKLADLYRGTVAAAIAELESMKGLLGSNYGQYGCDEELKAQIEAFDVENATYDELVAIYPVIGQLRASFKINTPDAGVSYVRIKAGVIGWNDDAPYLGSANSEAKDGRAEFVTAADANSIFFYCEDECLVSYGSGKHLVNNNNFLGYSDDLAVAGTAISFNSAETFGLYNISFIGNNESARALYIHQNNYTDAATPGAKGDGYTFNLEAVNSLPVVVTSAGYATLYAPVALTIPTGVEAYYATSVEGDAVQLKQITTTIPANTGVILKANAGTYNFAIAASVPAIDGNILDGTIAREIITKEGTGSYYVLGVVDEKVGMYNPVNGADATTFINAGHKAYMYVEGPASSAGYRFDFGGTTGIDEVETEESDLVIYDLTGRRVNEMNRPGIYIVNGKKVLVK
ncbi:MAG: hypothetical protein IKM65_06580 [Bacteroidaceae bacterium]|nr:hypothetical protein [Bacteroidaceae bacterium]